MKSIRAIQPEGPYFVGGWCTNGLIAYEIAQQLQAQGQKVALLVLLATVNSGRLHKLSGTQRVLVQANENYRKIWFHLRWMTRLKFGDVPDPNFADVWILGISWVCAGVHSGSTTPSLILTDSSLRFWQSVPYSFGLYFIIKSSETEAR